MTSSHALDRAGLCVECGVSVSLHFDTDNRKLGCAVALKRLTQARPAVLVRGRAAVIAFPDRSFTHPERLPGWAR